MASLTAADLLARIAQQDVDADALKDFWVSVLDCPPPSIFELRNAVRRLPLDNLVVGIESYIAKQEEGSQPQTMSAWKYACAAAWNIKDKDNPDENRPQTPRRIRNANLDPDSPQWDGEAFHEASPEERQHKMATIIAREQAKR
jgi:hypothetical protein